MTDNMIDKTLEDKLAQFPVEQREMLRALMSEAEELGRKQAITEQKKQVLEDKKSLSITQYCNNYLLGENPLIARFRLLVAMVRVLHPQAIEDSVSIFEEIRDYDTIEVLKIAPWALQDKDFGWMLRDHKGKLSALLQHLDLPEEETSELDDDGVLNNLPVLETTDKAAEEEPKVKPEQPDNKQTDVINAETEIEKETVKDEAKDEADASGKKKLVQSGVK